jgi:hypothetical protein
MTLRRQTQAELLRADLVRVAHKALRGEISKREARSYAVGVQAAGQAARKSAGLEVIDDGVAVRLPRQPEALPRGREGTVEGSVRRVSCLSRAV